MNRFALPVPTIATLEHLNTRAELHGDESVLAIDLKFSMDCRSDVLAQFNPALRSMMYFKSLRPPSLPEQTALDLDEPDDAPDLRFPELEPLRWHVDLQGYTLTVDYGIGGKSAIRLTDCRVNAFRFECCEGGTVKVTWRVQRSQPDERIVGKLSGLLKHEVRVTLMPSPEAQAVLAESDEAEGDSEQADATDVFVEQHSSATAH